MSLASQALPLVGVAIGAVVSLAVSAVNERTRWRRQQSVRWDERRLNAYAEYAHTVKDSQRQRPADRRSQKPSGSLATWKAIRPPSN